MKPLLNNDSLNVDEVFMREALKEAELAYLEGEVPVGAVLVKDGEIIARAHNTRESSFSATAHAETTAIAAACEVLHGWRLSDTTLYVTLEPCPMCAGAIVNARVPRVVFGAYDASMGAMGSVLDLVRYPLPFTPTVTGGLLKQECGTLLTRFFDDQRKNKSKKLRNSVHRQR